MIEHLVRKHTDIYYMGMQDEMNRLSQDGWVIDYFSQVYNKKSARVETTVVYRRLL